MFGCLSHPEIIFKVMSSRTARELSNMHKLRNVAPLSKFYVGSLCISLDELTGPDANEISRLLEHMMQGLEAEEQ